MHFRAHIIESVITLTALIGATVVLGMAFARLPKWQGLAKWSAGSAIVQIACGVTTLLFLRADHGGQGIVEFAGVAAGMPWLMVVSFYVVRLPDAVSAT